MIKEFMSVGILTLNRFNGQEKFSISDACITQYDKGGKSFLNFEIETDEKPIKTLPDTKELYARPNAEFKVLIKDFSWNSLAGKRFMIPDGYDEESEDYLTCFYYCEHEVTDNNVIEVIERNTDKFHVHITGTCIDVNYYDDSKALTKIDIDAWFKAPLIEMH